MALNIQELSKSELAEKFQRARATLTNLKKGTEAYAERTADAVGTLAGGAIVGAIEGMSDTGESMVIPGTEIPVAPVASFGLIAMGIMGMGGQQSRTLVNIGSGMGAAVVYSYVKDAVQKSRAD